MQRKIESFFKVTTTYNETNKKYFIYDPANSRAYFTTRPDDTLDTFVDTKEGVKLYYRKNESEYIVPIIQTHLSVPIIKSNLQKAVRRKDVSTALASSVVLLQTDPISFLRRLPVIFIEDVCLTTSIPIVVWLMMADKSYKLTNGDIELLLKIVQHLCVVDHYYDDSNAPEFDQKALLRHDSLQYSDTLHALYYRSLYGGMKGDMSMLRNAIYYYHTNPELIINASLTDHIPDFCFRVIPEAIDFHPLPQMLPYIKRHMSTEAITEEEIKKLIWFAESGVNVRKDTTIHNQRVANYDENWPEIRKYLSRFRHTIIHNKTI